MYEYNGIYNVDSNQTGTKMSAQGHLWVFNDPRGNPRTTGQAAAECFLVIH